MADSGAGPHTEKDGAQLSLTSDEIKAAATPVQNKTGLPPADCSLAVGITPECRMTVGKEECEHAEKECIGGNEVVIHGDHQAGIVTWEEETSNSNWVPLSTKVNHVLEENFKNDINKQFDFEEDDVKLSFNLASYTKVDKETQNETNIRRVDRIQVYTGCFDEKSCACMNPTEAENQLSFKNDLDGTLRDSITRGKDSKNIFASPTIESFIVLGNGIWLIKIRGGKVYILPFVFATTPKVECFEGFQHINHHDVWYRLNYSSMGKLCLQNVQRKNHIELYEFSESSHGRNETDQKCTNGRHGFSNECTMAETLTVLEGFRNSSADTDHKTGGEIVTKTDKKACKRHENDRGGTNERDTDEKHNEGTEEKSETGASISFGGNIVNKLQAETELALDLNFPLTQMGIHSFTKGFSGGEASHLSGHTDKTNEKDRSQTSNEEVNPLQARSMNFGPLGETNKTILQETSVEDSHQLDGRKTAKKSEGDKNGDQDKILGVGSVDTCNGNANQLTGVESKLENTHSLVENVSEETENKPERAHLLGCDQTLENNSGGKIRTALNMRVTFEEKQDHTARNDKGQTLSGGTSQMKKEYMSSDQTEIPEGNLSQDASTHYQSHAHEADIAGNFKDTSGLTVAETIYEFSEEDTDHILEGHEETSKASLDQIYEKENHHQSFSNAEEAEDEGGGTSDGDNASKDPLAVEDQAMHGRESIPEGITGLEGSDKIPKYVDKISLSCASASEIISEERPPHPPLRKRKHSTKSVTEKSKQLDWRSNEGNSHDLKLLIKHPKKQGGKNINDVFKHVISCSLNFKLMWNFCTQTDCGKKILDPIVVKHCCQISLLDDDDLKEFFMFKVSNEQFQDESSVKEFVDAVLHKVYNCAQESLSIQSVEIDPRIKEDVLDKLKERKEVDITWIELVDEDNSVAVYSISQVEHQTSAMQIMKKVIADASESFFSHENMVDVDYMWYTVLTKLGYLVGMDVMFPNTKISQDEEKNDVFLLKGHRDEVEAAVRHLKELQKKAREEVQEQSFYLGDKFELFTYSEMHHYIDTVVTEQYSQCVVWIPNHQTKKMYIFSRQQAKNIDKIIKGCVQVKQYQLSKIHPRHMSESIRLIEELKNKYRGKLVIHQSNAGLLVTAADDIFESVDTTMQEILEMIARERDTVSESPDDKDKQVRDKMETNIADVHQETTGLLSEKDKTPDRGITRNIRVWDENLFRKIVQQHFSEFKENASKHGINICILDAPDKFGFQLKGSHKEVAQMSSDLEERIESENMHLHLPKEDNSAGYTGNIEDKTNSSPDDVESELVYVNTQEETTIFSRSGSLTDMKNIRQLLTDPGLASEDGATAMVSCEKIFLVESRSVYECMIKVVRWIKKTGLEHTVEVRELNEPPRVGFVLQGPSDRVRQMTGYIKKVQEGIITQKYSAFSASDISYLGSTEGKHILAKLEEENNCTIEITYPGKVTLVEDLYSGGAMGSCMMVTFIFPHDHSVILFNGEVEKCTTDIIVTPVMSPFSSTGPQKSPFISTESTKLSMYVPLCIPKAKHSLIQNICDTLCYTGDKQCGKVGFAISPLGGWDLRWYIKIFLFAINDFFCKSQGITGRKVYLCTSEIDIFARMKGVAIDYFSSFITGHNKAGDSYTVDFDASSINEPSMLPSDPVLHFEKVEVRVETGELSQTEADVIVNTTSENLDLNGGTISKSILKAAGQTIQDECKKAYPFGICPGKVARTTGGKMKCKNIFHGALKPHKSQDWDKILKKFVDACLTQASNMKFKSIAFPALGTGNLELPRDRVAHIMTSCVKEFSSKKFNTLEKVTFVIYHTDEITLKVFQDAILKFKPAEKEKTESSDIEIHVTGLKDKVNKVIASIKTELKRLTYEDHPASEDKLKQNIPSTISQPSKGAAVEHKSSGASMNLASMDYSEEKCCAVVSGKIRSKEELEKDITNFGRSPKHVVYPYDMEKKTALIIFKCEEDATNFLNPNSTSLPYKIQSLEPQILQKLETAVAETVVKRASDMGQLDTLVKEIKEKSGVEVITVGNQVCLKGVTAIQMQIAQSCLEEFCGVNLHILLRQGIKITSPVCSQDEGYIVDKIEGVSEIEFKALKILIDDINAQRIDVVWKDDAILITTQLESTSAIIQTLNIQLKALRGRQMEEIFLDEDYKNVVRDVIAEMQSKDAICIYDEEKGQVIMYCVRQDDIMKFKHKLKFKSGKLKETRMRNKRFAENTQSMEASQGNSSSSVRSAVIRHEFSWSKNASSVEIFYTKEKIKVAVYTADILNLPVECIVNAANDRMQHGGGVAKVIADAAGPELVQEGDAIIMKKGRIPVGGQVTTTAGRLQYRCIIHTVGPCWLDYQPHNLQNIQKCAGDLYAAIYGCFTEAERNGLSTVALPAVSSGIYAVPQEMCAVQYARAVLDYSTKSEQGKSLTEIHFIDKLPHLVKLMQDTFRTMIKNGNVPNYNIQKYVTSSSNYQQLQSKETGRKGHKDGDNAGKSSQRETTKLGFPIHYESTEHTKTQFVFQISAKPVVCIYDGDILKLKNMDAIVCPDDTKGSGKGAVAAELRKKHKYRQQKESCFKLEKPEIGDVAISFGEENPFHVIVHVVIESDSHQKPEFKRTMEKSFDNILRKTNEWVKVKTLAMPLFGVKNVSLVKPWAELFLDRFAAFCNEVQNPNLAEIHIITHVSSSTAYSTLKNVFCDFAAKIKSAQHLKLPPNSDSKDYMANRGNVAKDDGDADDSCIICMCPKTDPKALSCGHSFCSGCIDQMFEHKPVCPVCGKIVGTLTGDQPKNGKMEVNTSKFDLAGYEGHGSIVITYDFPAGRQESNHPSPGNWYTRMMRIAYLPNTSEGRTVCRMLQLAFKRRLVFTISQSRTTGTEGLTWNDIHHKTNSKPGGQFGYPDPEYLSRVKDELAAKGITEADLPPE